MYNFIWQIGEHFIIIYYENAPQKLYEILRRFAPQKDRKCSERQKVLRKTERAQKDIWVSYRA